MTTTRLGPPPTYPRWDIYIIYTTADGMVYSINHSIVSRDSTDPREEEQVEHEARYAARAIIALRDKENA